jgi:hypothetical protein
MPSKTILNAMASFLHGASIIEMSRLMRTQVCMPLLQNQFNRRKLLTRQPKSAKPNHLRSPQMQKFPASTGICK